MGEGASLENSTYTMEEYWRGLISTKSSMRASTSIRCKVDI